jgi:hypothetical protein
LEDYTLSLVRKAFWPAFIALAVMVLLGAMGQGGTKSAFAKVSTGDVCLITNNTSGEDIDIDGEDIIGVDQTNDYSFYVQDDLDSYGDVNLDDDVGDSDITSEFGDDINNTDHLSDLDVENGDNVCGKTDDELIADLAADVLNILEDAVEDGEPCALLISTACAAPTPDDHNNNGGGFGDVLGSPGVNDGDIDCGYAQPLGTASCNISHALLSAAADAIAAEIFDGNDDCDDLGTIGEHAVIDAANGPDNVTNEFVAGQLHDYVQDSCHNQWINSRQAGDWGDIDYSGTIGDDGYVEVDVTCNESGQFDLSFANVDGDPGQITVKCGDEANKTNSSLKAYPTKVEIVPAQGSVSHSMIEALLADKNNLPSITGRDVFWTTDKCAIESSYFDNSDPSVRENNFEGQETIYKTNLNANYLPSADAVENSDSAKKLPDSTSGEDNTTTFQVTSSGGTVRTVAGAILHCGAQAVSNVTPGTANITAVIEVPDGSDIVLTTTVTVVGPPASPILVAADQTSVKCGDRVTVTVTVKDAAGQNVSDHTRVEAVTNAGGVLGGTGSTVGGFNNVNPVSSTVAETFSGVATFYLITSEAQPGIYDVTIATGGGGSVADQQLGGLFSTPVVTGHVQVSCASQVPTFAVAAPATPAATITAPRTGQGITAPNTGDAGLAAADSGNAWLLYVVIGGVAFALAGVASVKFARR